MAYAEGTTVTVERSVAEAQALLKRHGVADVGWTLSSRGGRIQFMRDRTAVQFTVLYPPATDDAVTLYPSGKLRPPREHAARLEQIHRERWRALVLVLKGKLEAVDAGVETWEEAFLPHILLPGGETVMDRVAPALAAAEPVTASLLQLER